jgi:hypothetical protein
MSVINFTFDEESHIYRVNSVPIPSVTQILKDLGLTPDFPPGDYRVRGQKAHKACEWDDLGMLDEDHTSPVMMGYVRAWRAVCAEQGWVWNQTGIEERLYDPLLIVAGTIDRVRDGNDPLIVDIKSGAAGKEAALQTAGYAQMRFPRIAAKVKRCTVEIHADGTYNAPKFYGDYRDITAWMGAVELWKWKTRK